MRIYEYKKDRVSFFKTMQCVNQDDKVNCNDSNFNNNKNKGSGVFKSYTTLTKAKQ